MPFKSQAQRAYMYAKHPEIAKRFEKETPKGKTLPYHVPSKSLKKHKARVKKYNRKEIRKMV